MTRRTLLLAMILLAGLALRIHHLGTESLWLDEGAAIRVASLPMAELVRETGEDVHPPAYRALLHSWLGALGRSESAARGLSVACGVLSLLLLFRIGALGMGESVGLLAASLLAVSPLHIRYSQEATSYSLLILIALTSFHFYAQWRRRGRAMDAIGYVLSTALLLYIHNAGVFVIAGQWVAEAVQIARRPATRASDLRSWLVLQAAVAAFYLPWFGVLVRQLESVSRDFWIPRPTPLTLAGTALDFAGSLPLLVLGGVCALAGTALAPFWVTAWAVVPILVPFLASLVSAPIFLTRIVLPALPAVFLLMAAGAWRPRSAWLRIALASLLLGFSVWSLVPYYRDLHKERWREVAQDLEKATAPGDVVLVNAGFCKRDVLDYYWKRTDVVPREFPSSDWRVKESDLPELNRLSEGHNRIWVVLSHSGDAQGLIPKELEKSYRLVERKPYAQKPYRWSREPNYVGIEVLRYERKARLFAHPDPLLPAAIDR